MSKILFAITIIFILGITAWSYVEMFEEEEEVIFTFMSENITLINAQLNDSHLTDIKFFADEIIFEDGNITITWNESGVLGLEQFDNMIWNIGNKTFTYALVLEGEQ